jgi:hypothetical protein
LIQIQLAVTKVVQNFNVLDQKLTEKRKLLEKRITLDTGNHKISELDDDSIDSIYQAEESLAYSKNNSSENKKEEEEIVCIDEDKSDDSQERRNKIIDTNMKELFEIMMQNEKFNLKGSDGSDLDDYVHGYPGKTSFYLQNWISSMPRVRL